MNTGLEKQGLDLCSWVPGSALKGRPGMTTEFFRSLLRTLHTGWPRGDQPTIM